MSAPSVETQSEGCHKGVSCCHSSVLQVYNDGNTAFVFEYGRALLYLLSSWHVSLFLVCQSDSHIVAGRIVLAVSHCDVLWCLTAGV